MRYAFRILRPANCSRATGRSTFALIRSSKLSVWSRLLRRGRWLPSLEMAFPSSSKMRLMKRAEFIGAAIFAFVFSVQSRAQESTAGELVFKHCSICHQVGVRAKNTVGPSLNGIIGRKAGSDPGYAYSTGFKSAGLTWDDDTLKSYIRNPKSMFPTTKMAFAGLTDDRQIGDLLAYLKQFASDGKRKR
jgi:cytochrome c